MVSGRPSVRGVGAALAEAEPDDLGVSSWQAGAKNSVMFAFVKWRLLALRGGIADGRGKQPSAFGGQEARNPEAEDANTIMLPGTWAPIITTLGQRY